MKCFYCYEEYKLSKRPLLSIRDANLFSEGVGYCFEHRKRHLDSNISTIIARMENDYRRKMMEESMKQQIQGSSIPERLFGGGIFRFF